ncbi:MAG: DUF4231 domain-containing protein [Anaerolineae bacterium]|nr:DUF4231 domain-containing protein [Anaerolineae bacterium]
MNEKVSSATLDETPPTSQGGDTVAEEHWTWWNALPKLDFKPHKPNPNYQLIDPERLTDLFKANGIAPDSLEAMRIKADINFMNEELLRLYRERDHNAALQQNRYRLYQIGFTFLAMLAAVLGSLQSLALASYPRLMPFVALLETIVALGAVYLATISGREPPLPLWLRDRRRAEQMRREYFRYLLNLAPYEGLDVVKRQQTLSSRAADINRGDFPEEPGIW